MGTTRQKLIKKLDQLFSIYIRTKDADHRGMNQCYTCDKVEHWKKMDAGHFQSRGKFSTRWDPRNVKPQCKRCNGFRSGEKFKFARHLDQDYGPGTAQEIETESNQTRKWSIPELEELVDNYTQYRRTNGY
jgi:hypothetical protein